MAWGGEALVDRRIADDVRVDGAILLQERTRAACVRVGGYDLDEERQAFQRPIDNVLLMQEPVAVTSERDERRVAEARAVLLRAGADALERRPWQHPNESPDDTALARFALWRAASPVGTAGIPELEAGLALIDSARSDLDALETALVFTARAEGMTWARIAETTGMRSPQAAQQRYQRSAERQPAQRSRRSTGEAHD